MSLVIWVKSEEFNLPLNMKQLLLFRFVANSPTIFAFARSPAVSTLIT